MLHDPCAFFLKNLTMVQLTNLELKRNNRPAAAISRRHIDCLMLRKRNTREKPSPKAHMRKNDATIIASLYMIQRRYLDLRGTVVTHCTGRRFCIRSGAKGTRCFTSANQALTARRLTHDGAHCPQGHLTRNSDALANEVSTSPPVVLKDVS